MKYCVIMTTEAFEVVDAYLDFIALNSALLSTPRRWLKKALRAIITLRSFPHRCQLAPENQHRDYEIRMLRVDRSLFLYAIDEQNKVVRVFGFRTQVSCPDPRSYL